jgi:Niemann-Pick C1 protein
MAIVLVSYCLMFLYVGINLGEFPSRVGSGFALGFRGILIVLSAFAGSIGLLSYLGLGLTMISVEVVPFLILAIGVDNMFILRGSFTRAQGTLADRLEKTLKDVGPSILIAALC